MMSNKFFLIVFITFFLHFSQPVRADYVQMAEQKVTANTNNITTGVFTTATKTGNLLVCWIYYNSSAQSVSSVTDTASNTYQLAVGPTTGTSSLASWRQEIWYAYNITGASNLNVTATLSGTFNAIKAISCHEYAGVVSTSNPKDVTGGRAQTSTANVSPGAVTTTQANDLVFAAGIFGGSNPVAGSGYATRSSLGSNVLEEKLAASAGSINPAFSNAAQDAVTQVATFKTTSAFSNNKIAIVQSAKSTGSSASPTATLTGVTAGNFIVVTVVAANSASISSVSDGTNTYTLTANSPSTNTSASAKAWIAYRTNVTGGSTTITVNFSTSVSYSFWIAEFSGVSKTSPLDLDAAHAATTSSTSINDPGITPTMNGELLVGVGVPANSITSVNAPWIGTGDILAGDAWSYYFQNVRAATTVNFSQSPASQWAAMIAAFKPASRANPAAINNPTSY